MLLIGAQSMAILQGLKGYHWIRFSESNKDLRREQRRFLNRYNVISIETGKGYSWSRAANHFVIGLPMKSESDNEVQLNFIALPFVLEVYKQNFQRISLSQNTYYLPRESFFGNALIKNTF